MSDRHITYQTHVAWIIAKGEWIFQNEESKEERYRSAGIEKNLELSQGKKCIPSIYSLSIQFIILGIEGGDEAYPSWH